MKLTNIITVYTKRILVHRIYILMLAVLPILTAIYTLLPAKSQSADIHVALYSEETPDNTDALLDSLDSIHSLYDFYLVSNQEELQKAVKSGYAECGYMIPALFFDDYIAGHTESNPIIQYTTPSTALGATINETIFSCIFKLCSGDILLIGVDDHALDNDLLERLDYYSDSDDIFRIEDTVSGEFSFSNITYQVKLPVYELCLVFILFSGLLGLLLYQQDVEKNMYVSLNHTSRLKLRCISVGTAMIPVLAMSLLCACIMNISRYRILHLAIYSLCFYIGTLLLSMLIRKSTLLVKILPLIMLAATIACFLSTLI